MDDFYYINLLIFVCMRVIVFNQHHYFFVTGEHGFFKIVRGGAYNPIGCYWAVPDVTSF
jgi:hypothetical protein